MCDTCFRTHLRAKSCRHHVLIDINQIQTAVRQKTGDVEKCTTHAMETIKYYCRKHETVGCGDCMIPVHSPCKPENIKGLSKQFHKNRDFKSLVGQLQHLTKANHENNKKVQENKKANKVMLDKALKEIKCFKTEINNYLDKAEASITKEATDIERKNDNLLTILENDCKLVSSKITEVSQKLDKELYQDSALFIQTVDCKPRVLDIEREVSRIQRENDIRAFEFMPDKQLHNMVTSIEKLGGWSTKRIAANWKERKHVKEKKETGKETPIRISVGARVCPTGYYRYYTGHHGGQPGTVTAVNPDGTVDVTWDDSGWTGRCKIGLSVELM